MEAHSLIHFQRLKKAASVADEPSLSKTYNHFFHLKNMYGAIAATSISNSANA